MLKKAMILVNFTLTECLKNGKKSIKFTYNIIRIYLYLIFSINDKGTKLMWSGPKLGYNF